MTEKVSEYHTKWHSIWTVTFIPNTWNQTCFSHWNTWQVWYSDSQFILFKGLSKNQFVGSCSQLNPSQLVPRLGKGLFMNDVTQIGGRGVGIFVTQVLKTKGKWEWPRGVGEGQKSSNLSDVIYESPLLPLSKLW